MEPSRGKRLCLPFESEAHDEACVADPARFRPQLEALHAEPPERFPERCAEGCGCHDQRWSITPPRWTRRLERTATEERFQIRPSCVLPDMAARTEAVAKARSLRHWGVPCDALASGFGRDPLCWSRAEMAVGRPAMVGSPVKEPAQLPQHGLADEQHTRALGQEVSVPTTVGGGCILGAPGTDAASADARGAAYGDLAQEVRELSPTSSPQTVGPDGGEGTPSAWRSLFPTVCIIWCCLHAVLKIAARCVRDPDTRTLVRDRVWAAYDSFTRAPCSQRRRRLREWATAHRPAGVVRWMGLTRCGQGPPFARASRVPGAHRPANALDRLLHHQDRRLYARRSLHGTPDAARLAVRAMALEWNFHPYGARGRRDDAARRSPFHDLNGFESPPNWLHNLLIASSMGGRKL